MRIENPAIPLNSIVVVLGANGYLALLEAGYRVRETVHDITHNVWAHDLFDAKFPGEIESFRIVNFMGEEAFGDAFQGYLVDTQDTARLIVAVLVLPDITNERIFAFYKHYTWNELCREPAGSIRIVMIWSLVGTMEI
ncbi:uncharacterized protein BDV17DRAFT_286106 [Aspergillus undulatus]|uniref:uncharacterized protein n=1 Tax=Aspergillus undulatus TaxID=1810928 RepID=UPI003CCDFAD1